MRSGDRPSQVVLLVATGDYHNKPMNHNSFVLFGLWGLTFSGGVDADWSSKSTHTAHMCGGPSKFGGTKELVDQKTYQLRELREPERRADQAMEGTTKLNL